MTTNLKLLGLGLGGLALACGPSHPGFVDDKPVGTGATAGSSMSEVGGDDGGEVTSGGSDGGGDKAPSELDIQGFDGDPTQQVVYVSVGPTDPNYPNELLAIGKDGELLWHSFVGSSPQSVAVADDGSIIYVELDGAESIVTVTPEGEVGEPFTVGYDEFYGPMSTLEMKVVPGHPSMLAVVFYAKGISWSGGLGIFDNGLSRIEPLSEGTWQVGDTQNTWYLTPTTVAIKDETRFYGYNGADTGFDFMTIDVADEGPSIVDVQGELFSGFFDGMVYRNGKLFVSNGAVVDPDQRKLLGTFPVDYDEPMYADETGSRVYFLRDADKYGWKSIVAFDPEKFTADGNKNIYVGMQVPDALEMTRWGDDGLAIRYEGFLQLIQGRP